MKLIKLEIRIPDTVDAKGASILLSRYRLLMRSVVGTEGVMYETLNTACEALGKGDSEEGPFEEEGLLSIRDGARKVLGLTQKAATGLVEAAAKGATS